MTREFSDSNLGELTLVQQKWTDAIPAGGELQTPKRTNSIYYKQSYAKKSWFYNVHALRLCLPFLLEHETIIM